MDRATVQEVEQLLEAAQGHFLFEGLMVLALATGMRCGELLALTWGDIDFQKGLVRVNKSVSRDKRDDETLYLRPVSPKTESGVREIHIAESVLTILQNHRNLQIETQLKTKNRHLKRASRLLNLNNTHLLSCILKQMRAKI